MLILDHRINTLDALKRVPSERGIEIDVRDYDGELVLTHDPFESGEPLEELLRHYHHACLVVNVKCDGLESRIRRILAEHEVERYFFLDVALPSLVKLVLSGEDRAAVRFSEWEPIELALAFAGKARWVWVDCFSHLPLDAESHRRLESHFEICLVSPELQGHPRSHIAELRRQLEGLSIDAVCTDFPEDWL